MQKAPIFIDRIIEAKNESGAVQILIDIAKELGIDKSYSGLVLVKDRLKVYQVAFKATRSRLDVSIPDLDLLLDVRREVAFAYNEIVDELSSTVNASKIEFGEDARKLAKGKSYIEVMNDDELKEKVGSKTATVLKEMIGTTDTYINWLNCNKLSYANWNTYRGMLESWKLFNDYLAGAIRNEQTIRITDAK